MTVAAPRIVIATVVALTLAAAGAVVASSRRPAARAESSRDFQRLVGGLGLGPSLDLSRCEADFDPRVGAACDSRCEPIPAGDAFCPAHPCSVLFER